MSLAGAFGFSPLPAFQRILAESLAACGLFRSELLSVSYEALKRERLRQSLVDGLRRQSFARECGRSCPVLDLGVRLLSVSVSRLDSNVIMADEVDRLYRKVATREARDAFFGYADSFPRLPSLCPVLRRAAQTSLSSRRAALRFRIECELSRCGVFPVFNTLTTDPVNDYIFEPGSRELRDFVARVRYHYGAFSYCAVLERGAEGKLHYHMIMVFDECRFNDPNMGRARNDHREIGPLKALWPFGHSSPVAVRYGPTDVYGRLGWKWPAKAKTGSPAQISAYCSDYVTKQHEMELNGCRTRMSRGFGLRMLAAMSIDQAVEAILTAGRPSWINGVKFPRKPPRLLLLRVAFSKVFAERCLRPLPKTRLGSISIASATLKTREFSPMSAGDCNVPMAGSKVLDPCRVSLSSCEIGGMI